MGWSDKHGAIGSFRVDRMCSVPEIRREDAVAMPKKFKVSDYIKKNYHMFGGDVKQVELHCDGDVMDSIIDRFGYDVETEIIDDDHFIARVEVAVNNVFFGWIFGFGGKVKIKGPEDVAAEYKKIAITLKCRTEQFSASFKVLSKPGYLMIADPRLMAKMNGDKTEEKTEDKDENKEDSKDSQEDMVATEEVMEYLDKLKKGMEMDCSGFDIKEGKTNPPKRYTSGSMILAMENAGQLIEDEELREQIKGSGIGTSATRDSIITKLVNNKYIQLNKKTQVLTPTFLGEIIYDVVLYSINGLLRADLTASWEYGLSGVAEGTITEDEYMTKLRDYVEKYTNAVKEVRNQNQMHFIFDKTKPYYKKGK